jgi:hypothetical protein
MRFEAIPADGKVFPGEYVLHEPTKEVVMCGAFNRDEDFIRAIGNGKSMMDKISNFKKIVLTKEENRERRASRCKGCSGG